MNSIIFLCIITFDYWIPSLIWYGYELIWALGFELGSSVHMVLGAPVVTPLKVSISMFLAWNLALSLEHGKYLWLEFHLAHWVTWWLALGKDILLAYHLYFQLGTHLNPQIVYMWCLACFWARFLGCGLSLNWSGVGVPDSAFRTSVKLLEGRGGGGVGISCVPPSGAIIPSHMN